MQIKKISKENFSNYGELISVNNNESEDAQTPQFNFDLPTGLSHLLTIRFTVG